MWLHTCEHHERLAAVLTAIESEGLRLNPSKCSFAKREVTFLGHVVGPTGIRPDPKKLRAIEDLHELTTVPNVRSVLGLFSYYRRFVPNFSALALPMTNLLKKRASWHWGRDQQEAFEGLKRALMGAPTLSHDDGLCTLELRVDASGLGLGAVLNKIDCETERPIAFLSRRLSPAETRYHSNELECLALVWALEKLRPYLFGQQFTVFTDNNALRWLVTKRNVERKYARWIMALQEYQFEVRHVKGNFNVVADALSRFPTSPPETTDQSARTMCCLVGTYFPVDELAVLQQADASTRAIITNLGNGNSCQKGRRFFLELLYKRNEASTGRAALLVTPSSLRQDVLKACHDAPRGGHLGANKTEAKVRQSHWWPKLAESCAVYVRSCVLCQLQKPPTGFPIGKMLPIPPPCRPFGSAFISETVVLALKSIGSRSVLATAGHPQTNGLVERMNRTLTGVLKMYVNFEQTDLDQKVPMAGLAINTSKQSSTGFTPFELLYGRSAVLPADSAFPWPTQSPERVEEFINRVNRWRKQAQLLILKRKVVVRELPTRGDRKPTHFNPAIWC